MKVKGISRRCGRGLVTALALSTVLSTGCASGSPAARFEAAARRAGLEAGEVAGAGFQHRTFAPAKGNAAGPLYVYFGGDGTPFVRRNVVARDPTPRRPLTLELLARGLESRHGPGSAVFLGRPCYHGMTAGCHPALWTVGRYSEPVVASMTAATARLIEGARQHVVLIGYSGGGTLALLVAERLGRVDAVVTVAANLDLDAWSALHGYSPLATSINPVTVAGIRADLVHLHLTGADDRNVPPSVHARLRGRLPAEALRTLAGFDHRCCWTAAWPRLLAELDARLKVMPPAPP